MKPAYRVLVCGSRHWTDRETIRRELARLPRPTVIIHGAARGADTIAGEVALELGMTVQAYPADWKNLGRAAGPIRNQHMLDDSKPDMVLAFPMRDSVGTWDMVRRSWKVLTRIVPCHPKMELG